MTHPERLRLDDLLAPFHEALKPRSRFRVGTEAEKFGVFVDDGAPVPYSGPRSIQSVFTELVTRFGWREEREYAEGDVIALRRDQSSITLEPGGQLELSGAPEHSINDTCAEFRAHMGELAEISARLGVAWLGLGFHPFATREQLPWVPKLRYRIMRAYLPQRGARALDMMLRTCTVQANLDYDSEADAIRKLRVALALQPIVTAMFANSPIVEGRLARRLSERAVTWLDVDPDRTGTLDFAWRDDMSFRSYVEWALDVPMFLIKRGDAIIENTGQTFRTFMRDGYRGAQANRADWDAHLNSLFPEVRLKNTLEVRGADGQADPLVCAVPALWKGLLYDERALDQAEALGAKLDPPASADARLDVATRALGASLAGRPVLQWAREVLQIASGGLARLQPADARGRDERVHLARLRALLDAGQSPADALLEQLDPTADLRPQLLEKARV